MLLFYQNQLHIVKIPTIILLILYMKKQIKENLLTHKPLNSGWKAITNTTWSSRTSLLKYTKNKNYSYKANPGLLTHHDENLIANTEYEFTDTKIQQKFRQSTRYDKCSRIRIDNIMKQRDHSQLIKDQYTEHIGKSMKSEHLQQTELERYKNLLQNQRREKLKLLKEQNEWKTERAKLLQQKQLFLFALDSLSINMNNKHHSRKGKTTRPQTSLGTKTLLNINHQLQRENKMQKQEQGLNKKSDEQCKENKILKQNLGNEIISKQHQQPRITKNIQQHLAMIKKIHSIHEQKQSKQQQENFKQKYHQATLQIQDLQNQLNQFKESMKKDTEMITQLNTELTQLKNKNQDHMKLNDKQKLKNNELIAQIKKNEELRENTEKNLIVQSMRNKQLQKQLKITKQQYYSRQQKERHCVQILKNFTKQLKINDKKIQQFLNSQELLPYKDTNQSQLKRQKKTYHEHLSYLLHLCKKKQSLYENLVEQFKQKMKQSDFRCMFLQKKINWFISYQSKLKDLVEGKDITLDALSQTILEFKY